VIGQKIGKLLSTRRRLIARSSFTIAVSSDKFPSSSTGNKCFGSANVPLTHVVGWNGPAGGSLVSARRGEFFRESEFFREHHAGRQVGIAYDEDLATEIVLLF
jgi:hypothetical protein